jgi:eukaryotic-like serine/threonine-protein kinase
LRRRVLRTFALKTFQTEVDPRQFSKECETWLSVSGHPSIAKAFGYGEFQGRPSILSHWYPFTLREQILAEWSTVQIYGLVVGLLDALKYLDKEFKLIHQDIKPANILLEKDLTPKLSDFGIVRAIKTDNPNFGKETFLSKKTVNDSGISGTQLYMAPEILFRESKPNVSTDIFSLGVTLYEKLTDQHPYLSNDGIFVELSILVYWMLNCASTVKQESGSATLS